MRHGAQTKVLHETLRRHIIAVDSRTNMIGPLQDTVSQDPLLTNNISTLVAKPDELPFPKHYLNLIWSENFVGPYGVDDILKRWRYWLQPEAYVVFHSAPGFAPTGPTMNISTSASATCAR